MCCVATTCVKMVRSILVIYKTTNLNACGSRTDCEWSNGYQHTLTEIMTTRLTWHVNSTQMSSVAAFCSVFALYRLKGTCSRRTPTARRPYNSCALCMSLTFCRNKSHIASSNAIAAFSIKKSQPQIHWDDLHLPHDIVLCC